ncbi:hypothetical protein N9053_00050 [bacterium]|nr:hypothetical protein [bacterium]MDB4557514.1 hypothetical protein [bacterium]
MRKLLVLILLLLIATKTVAILMGGPVPIELDAFGYWKLSALVMQGDLLMFEAPIAYRTPIYPWFLAVVRLLSGSHALQTLTVLQGFFSLGSLVIAASIAARITKLPKAFLLTLIVSLPIVSSFVFDAAVLSESMFIFMFMLNLLAILDYAKYGTATRASWVGFTFALTLLTRPIVILIWIPHLFFLLLIHIRKNGRLRSLSMKTIPYRIRLYHLIVTILIVTGCSAPWIVRNQLLFGKPFLTEFVGRNIWIVTFKDGSGAGLAMPSSNTANQLMQRLEQVNAANQWQDTWVVSNALVRSGLSDAGADQLMQTVALQAVQQDPSTFAYKAFRRVINYWRCAATHLPSQGQSNAPFYGQQTWSHSIPLVDFALKTRFSQSVILNTLLLSGLAFCIVLLIVNYPTRVYGLWLLSMLAYFSLVTGILEIPDYRYRIVVEPLVVLSFGSVLAILLSRLRKTAKVTNVA